MDAGHSRDRAVTPTAAIPVEPRYSKKKVHVLGKQMVYYEAEHHGSANGNGSGDTSETTIVFVHGNPTSSYMWRNVMPHCEGLGARLIAPDLIGYGDSDKLDNCEDVDRYSLKEQCQYFSTFLEAIRVNTNVVFVSHSWGGTLAAHWGSCQ